MRALLLALTTMTVMFVVACQKDEGGGGPAPIVCGPGHYVTPAYGNQCLPQEQCPAGSVRNPTQLSMCMDIHTGANIGPQRCGAGYVLTSQGCLQQCPDRPGWGLYGPACIQGVNGAGTGYNYNYYQYPYGQMPYGYGNPYYYYRPY